MMHGQTQIKFNQVITALFILLFLLTIAVRRFVLVTVHAVCYCHVTLWSTKMGLKQLQCIFIHKFSALVRFLAREKFLIFVGSESLPA
jgi:hypothetical protein